MGRVFLSYARRTRRAEAEALHAALGPEVADRRESGLQGRARLDHTSDRPELERFLEDLVVP